MSEVDRRMRFHCEISFTWNDPFLETSNKFGLVSHGLLANIGGEIGVQHIVPSQIADTPDGRNMLKFMKAREKSGFWVIEETIPEKHVTEFIEKVTSKKAVIMDCVDQKSGRIHLNFRFHESELKEISDLVLSAVSSYKGATLEFLGHSKGIFHDLSKIARDLEIVAVDIKFGGGSKIFEDFAFPGPCTRVRKHFTSRDNEMHYICYGESWDTLKNENIKNISREDKLYELNSSSKFIKFINSKMAEEKIIRLGVVDHFDGETLKTRFILPRVLLKPYLGILSLAGSNFPEDKMVITAIRDIKDIANDPI
ncbi:MAG: hypothetical protein AAE977_02500 [Thermoplasmataceae archaeon]|jgi:hypothetical protein